MRKMAALATAAVALVMAAPANAVLLQFTISGFDTLSGTVPAPLEFASFKIDSNPTIAAGDAFTGQGFFIRNVAGTYTYGSTTITTPQDLSFYAPSLDGGLFVEDGSLLAYDGVQIYTGPESAPVFHTGVFALTDYYSGSPITLTVTLAATTPSVPEPASWALMIGGFGLAGGALRLRRRTVTFARA